MPEQLPDDLSYESWVEYIFDHPVTDPPYWFELESPHWDDEASPSRKLDYLTQFFEQPEVALRYTPHQIDQGLNLIFDCFCSSYLSVIADETLPWPDRQRCIEAMVPLYANLMAPTYGDQLGHVSNLRFPDLPSFSCYMLWDVICFYGDMDHPDSRRIDETCFGVFERVLQLTAESCLESALHGLNHWHHAAPARVEEIGRVFLTRQDLSGKLRFYAQNAIIGGVN